MSVDIDALASDAVATAPTRLPPMKQLRRRVHQRRRNRRFIIIAITPLIAFGAIWAVFTTIDAATPGLITDAEQAASPIRQTGVIPGEFVWPAPVRGFVDLDELIESFVAEVLGWQPDQVHHDGTSGEDGPQFITISNLSTTHKVQLLAIPSPEGWGFIQVDGSQVSIAKSTPDMSESGGFAIIFNPPDKTASSTVEVRYTTNEILTGTTTLSHFALLADHTPRSVLSVLAIHTDNEGVVIGLSGGQFQSTDDPLPVTPSTEITTHAPVSSASLESWSRWTFD